MPIYKILRISAPLASLAVYCFSLMPPAMAQQKIGATQIFPTNSIFNARINTLPVDTNSATYINKLGATKSFHPDWGSDPTFGIPYNLVGGIPGKGTANFPIFEVPDESEAGPYPSVSTRLKIEGGSWSTSVNPGDRHVLQVNLANNTLYELYSVTMSGTHVNAFSGAIWNLKSNALRPDTWTSADAAGLPIFPLLVNYPEAAAGPIKHAFRMTGSAANGHIWPGRHNAGSSAGFPPFGQRFRLKKSFDISSFSVINKRILTAMQDYGLIYSDNGSSWFVSGAPDPRWDDNDLDALKTLKGSDFEAVDCSSLLVDPDSGATPLTTPPISPPLPTPKPWPKVH